MFPSEEHPSYGIFVRNFERQLTRLGACFPNKVVIKGPGKNVFQKFWKYIQFSHHSLRSIFKGKYDVIYVHYINHSLIPLIFILPWLKRKIIILNAHGGDIIPETALGGLIQNLTSSLVYKSQLLVVPSNYFKQVLQSKTNLTNSRIFVSPSAGVDTSKYIPKKCNPSEKFTIGYVGRIDKGKGWDIMLRALDQLNQAGIDFHTIIVGNGSQVNQLLRMIGRLELNDKIDYQGVKDQAELPEIYNNLDVFIFPSMRKGESLGLVGLEAMACGVPVIGSEMAGLTDYIRDNINGLFFLPGDENDLLNKIMTFKNMDPEKKAMMKKAARDTSLEYDAHVVIQKLYNKVLSVARLKKIG